jgi:hypothetical protein
MEAETQKKLDFMTLMSMLEDEFCSQDFENLLSPECPVEDVLPDHDGKKDAKVEMYTSVSSPELSDLDFEIQEIQAYKTVDSGKQPKPEPEYGDSLIEIDNFLSDWDSF